MASGKSAVGPILADRLGWRHVDLDAEIVRAEGMSIAEIFRVSGEPAFRRLEAEHTGAIIERTRMVFVPGGGWITNPALPAGLPPGTLSVWLRVSPGVVLARLLKDGSGIVRPMLGAGEPADEIRRLLDEREPLYRRADLAIDTDARDVDGVVEVIEAEARALGLVLDRPMD